DNSTVVTGSMNPTKNGDETNDENVVIIKDKEIAELYLKEFERVWDAAKEKMNATENPPKEI
ncbi:MAG TPA: phospholipase D-like domain-containing protein, partial [Candidatus Nanoarchaeia archaeon]|nr:phospholipase D-like domain-containing protein [Candidatus Nanoarchaeia archaeon]